MLFWSAILLLVVCAALLIWVGAGRFGFDWDGPNAGGGRYVAKEAFLSPSEREFFEVLKSILEREEFGGEVLVSCQVRLADVIRTGGSGRSKARQGQFNVISAKSVDFVLFSGKDYSVLGVIELQDRTHLQAKRKKRDDQVREILAQAEVPLMEYRARASYDEVDVLCEFRRAIGGTLRARPLTAL